MPLKTLVNTEPVIQLLGMCQPMISGFGNSLMTCSLCGASCEQDQQFTHKPHCLSLVVARCATQIATRSREYPDVCDLPHQSLSAAALDLYTALKVAERFIDPNTDPPKESRAEILDQARAALAKAEAECPKP